MEIALDIAFQCEPRSSVREGTPRVVPEAAGRHDPVRRESAEEVSGHLSVPLRMRRLERTVERADERVRVLDRTRRARIPGRQSAHQALRALAVDHHRSEAHASGRAVPRRSVHATESDVSPGQGRLHAVVHVFQLAQHEVRDHAVLHRADETAGERLLPPESVAEHARHPSRVPAVQWPPRLRDAPRARCDTWRELRHLRPGVRASGTSAAQARRRGIPRQREISAARVESRPSGQSARAASRA